MMDRWRTLLCALALLTPEAARAQSTGGALADPKGPLSAAKVVALPNAGSTSTRTASSGPLPDIILVGIVRLPSGEQRAWVTVGESGQPSKTFGLRVGEKLMDLELREIDFRSGIVRVRQQGADVALSFKTHSTLNEGVRLLVQIRDYVEQVRPFAEAHTHAHELREQRERERIAREREEAERALGTTGPVPQFENGTSPE